MGVLKRFWMRLSGLAVCLVALVLPFGPRLFLAKVLNYLSNPLRASASLMLRRPLTFWNQVLMGMVFFLGLPIAKLLLSIGGGARRFAPKPGRESYWVSRPQPEVFDDEVENQF